MPLLKEPAITLEGVKVRDITISSLELDVSIRVTNQNIFGVTLRDLPFTVSCVTGTKEQRIATGNAGTVKIRGNDSTVLTVPVTAHNAGIIRAVTSFVALGGIDLTVQGTAFIDCLVICPPLPFTKSIRLTTAQLTEALTAAAARKIT
jgi:LEA14-like dessication related protein